MTGSGADVVVGAPVVVEAALVGAIVDASVAGGSVASTATGSATSAITARDSTFVDATLADAARLAIPSRNAVEESPAATMRPPDAG